MRNSSPSDLRVPSRVPRRGLAALALTTASLALLVNFKSPDEMIGRGTSGVGSLVAVVPTTNGTDPAQGSNTVAAASPTPQALVAGPPAPAPTQAPTQAATQPPAKSSGKAPRKAAPAAPQVITGQAVRTPYGTVQVQITMANGSISDVQALQLPTDRSYSRRISQVVGPILHDETLQAQSSRIQIISGATYTSRGYAMSLQSALDQASAAA